MKKETLLEPRKASLNLFTELEKLKLIKLIRPAKKTLETKTGAVSRFCVSSAKSGARTLMGAGKKTQDIKLS